VHCRAAARPMWAAKEPEPSGDVVSRMITKEITSCRQITELEDVCSKWEGRLNHINVSAALVRYAKLSRGQNERALLKHLEGLWLGFLPEADLQGCANALWAGARLGVPDARFWSSTWEVFIRLVGKETSTGGTTGDVKGLLQPVSNALWACAKLHKQPDPDHLQLLLATLLQPPLLSAAKAQDIANTVWSLARLQQLPGWQGGVSEQNMQQLLGPEQLKSLTATAKQQEVANVLLALALTATSVNPLISLSFAQHAATQLLEGRLHGSLVGWVPQAVTNSMWACGELGLFDEQFMAAAVAAAPQWVPSSTGYDLSQALTACARLQYKNWDFLQQLLQKGQQLLQPGKKVGCIKPLSPADKVRLAAICSWSIALLDMQELAGTARALVASSGILKQPRTHPSNLRRLWMFHSWLLQHQLLDGKGLTGLLTEQQLQQGEKEAAVYGNK